MINLSDDERSVLRLLHDHALYGPSKRSKNCIDAKGTVVDTLVILGKTFTVTTLSTPEANSGWFRVYMNVFRSFSENRRIDWRIEEPIARNPCREEPRYRIRGRERALRDDLLLLKVALVGKEFTSSS